MQIDPHIECSPCKFADVFMNDAEQDLRASLQMQMNFVH